MVKYSARTRRIAAATAAILALVVAFTLTPSGAEAVQDFRRSIAQLYVPGFLKVGSSGSRLELVSAGQATIGSGATTGTLTLTGVVSTDYAVATINSGNSSSRTVLKATPATDSVALTLSGTPGASTNVSVAVFRVAD